ncbi:trypsin-like serine peptidase [Pseudochelatococcus lubricantis]|uniref:trypsin-like serine peptidase n=1 Tax=Pseudochelatococcus lubricantis TaxID=1538102 RepID=UPI0035F079D0
MAIILANMRPSFLVADDRVAGLPATDEPWAELAEAEAILTPAIRATGRLESQSPHIPFLGTAFLVAPRLAATARSVAETIRTKDTPGQERVPAFEVSIDFAREHGSAAERRVPVERIEQTHPYWDFALLRLADDPPGVEPLRLSDREPAFDDAEGLRVCAIGYPAFDPRNDPELQKMLFGDMLGVKRVMPGRLLPENGEIMSWGHLLSALAHDCTTMGGMGGAPLIDIETGLVQGINFAGRAFVANYATPAFELARDPYVRLAGCTFAGGGLPDWLGAWDGIADRSVPSSPARRLKPAEVIAAEAGGPQPPAPSASAAPPTLAAPVQIFADDRIYALHDLLIDAGLAQNHQIALLFGALSVDYISYLPSEGSGSEVLLARLREINRHTFLISGRVPMYHVLRSARQLIRINPPWLARLDPIIAEVVEFERGLDVTDDRRQV